MELLLIWLLFGVVSAVVASNKGRDGCGWFLLGFLLGPFGLILSLVVSSNKQEIKRTAIKKGVMKECPFCAELIKARAIKCRFCGEDLKPQKVNSTAKLETNSRFIENNRPDSERKTITEKKDYFCFECGFSIKEDDFEESNLFCPECGAHLIEE